MQSNKVLKFITFSSKFLDLTLIATVVVSFVFLVIAYLELFSDGIIALYMFSFIIGILAINIVLIMISLSRMTKSLSLDGE